MIKWNAVATVGGRDFRESVTLLGYLGAVERTAYYNVLVLRAEDPRAAPRAFLELAREFPDAPRLVSRLMPLVETFEFRSPEEFEERAGETALRFLPELAGKHFHVRMHRRGFKGKMRSVDEERLLDDILLDALAARGEPGAMAFDDPDAILAVESLDNRAGMSVWSREDLARYPFLKID